MPSWSVSLSLTHHTRHTRHQRTTKRGTPSTDASLRPAERKIRVAIRQARLTEKTTPSISIVSLSSSIVFLSRAFSEGSVPFETSLAFDLSSLSLFTLGRQSSEPEQVGFVDRSIFLSLSIGVFLSLSLALDLSDVCRAFQKETRQNKTGGDSRFCTHTPRPRKPARRSGSTSFFFPLDREPTTPVKHARPRQTREHERNTPRFQSRAHTRQKSRAQRTVDDTHAARRDQEEREREQQRQQQ